MIHHDDTDLARRFARAAPTAPDTSGWGPDARRRYARRRAITATVCAMVVVAGLSTVLLVARQLSPSDGNAPIASEGPADVPPSTPAAKEPDIAVTNSTTERLWIFLPWGNQADIAPGATLSLGPGCEGAIPLRAETLDGTILDYYETCTQDSRWNITSLAPFAEVEAIGRVAGTLTLRSGTRSEPVVRAGVTFTGSVIRSTSVGRQGQFTAALPEGVYTIKVASSAIPPGTTVTRCPTTATVTVAEGSTAEIDLFCDG